MSKALATAIEVGNGCKQALGIGKESYVVWVYKPDSVLDFVQAKIRELYPAIAKRSWVSVVGVTLDLTKPVGLIKVVNKPCGEFLVIHKKMFKRFLKKAISRNLNTNR